MTMLTASPFSDVSRAVNSRAGAGVLNLATNTNALGASLRAIDAIRQAMPSAHLYPDPAYISLRSALSVRLKVGPDQVVTGPGSDGLIQLLAHTLLDDNSEVIVADPAFHRYEDAATLNRAVCRRVPLTPEGTHDLQGTLRRINSKTRLVWVTNPHNPTGTIVTDNQVHTFLDRVPDNVIVVFDEAYFEYAVANLSYPNTLNHVRENRTNVVVLRTMSKAYALAGLRVGYGVMSRSLASLCERHRQTFNISSLAEMAAVAALEDIGHLWRSLLMNGEGKRFLYAAFEDLGLTYLRTNANFIWVDVMRDCREVARALATHGVLVRAGDIFGALTHLRVTIGRSEENSRFIAALTEVLSEDRK